MQLRSIADTISHLPRPEMRSLPAPEYVHSFGAPCLALAVKSMDHHMTDEGWQIMQALQHNDYLLAGHGITTVCRRFSDRSEVAVKDWTDVRHMLCVLDPSVVVVQDKREYEGLTAEKRRDPNTRFHNVSSLRESRGRFRVTILKDAQHDPAYNREAASEIGCHAWVVYYHPKIVSHLAPYTRERHLIRTYHSIDATLVPEFRAEGRRDCILSGAIGRAYPLRSQLVKQRYMLKTTNYLRHPGYHQKGCQTPDYLAHLSRYKVAICTSSIYGYALRKIIEASACGCKVITDLPTDEVLPVIDNNLIRVPSSISTHAVAKLVEETAERWDAKHQYMIAREAQSFYDYRQIGFKLVSDIERMRRNYQ